MTAPRKYSAKPFVPYEKWCPECSGERTVMWDCPLRGAGYVEECAECQGYGVVDVLCDGCDEPLANRCDCYEGLVECHGDPLPGLAA